jgi:hypothetical protein
MIQRHSRFAWIATLTVMALSISNSFSAMTDAKFAEHKKHMMEKIDQEISILQTLKSCVSSAANHDAAKACHEQAHSAREKLHGDMKHEHEHEHGYQSEANKPASAPAGTTAPAGSSSPASH